MELAAETTPLPVRLVPTVGDALQATFFLRRPGRDGETLGDRLNDAATAFLPVEVEGETEMVHLSWVAYLEMAAESPEIGYLEELGAQRAAVSLRLTTGDTLFGEVIYILPPDRSRISDLLNDGNWRFLLLDTGAKVCYVHRDAIATVRQL